MKARAYCAQMWLLGVSLAFLSTVWTILLAQSQDSINATLMERVSNVTARLDRIENGLLAVVGTTIASLIAQVINIRQSNKKDG